MSLDDEPQAPVEIIEIADADGFSDQARNTVAPFVVQAFDKPGLSAAFAARPVLPGREPLGISLIKVRIDELSSIAGWQREPQVNQTLCTAIANVKADDLPSQARDGEPQILITPLEAIANH